MQIACAAGAVAQTADQRSAVILMYHRFGEDRYPSTNIQMDQFQAHLDHLAAKDFRVIPLTQLIEAMKTGDPLPDKSVVITIDDAYRSFAVKAWPRLKEKGFPATLFVATQAVNEGYADIMSWDQLRRLRAEGLSIGHHGHGHVHMVDVGVDAAMADIAEASALFEQELGDVPKILAYPFGEYSLAHAKALEAAGFTAALAQHSGAVGLDDDLYAIPRFALNERYGGLDRFRLLAGSRALPAKEIVPDEVVLDQQAQNPPAYGFTVTEEVAGLSAMNCFASHLPERIEPMVLDDRVEIRMDKPFPPGRQRITCTLPGPGGRWYWRGRFFYVPVLG
ncbi:MAG: polysaccharide deacetylase family protein [Rhodothalassiaceae bacterium]